METIIDYINCHIEDFKNGVDSNYVINMDIKGWTFIGKTNKLNKLCNVKRIRQNGKQARLYTLKDDYNDIIKQYVKTNPTEENKQAEKKKALKTKKEDTNEEEEIPHIYYKLGRGKYVLLA